jgi:hypothetical protein
MLPPARLDVFAALDAQVEPMDSALAAELLDETFGFDRGHGRSSGARSIVHTPGTAVLRECAAGKRAAR